VWALTMGSSPDEVLMKFLIYGSGLVLEWCLLRNNGDAKDRSGSRGRTRTADLEP